MNLHSLYAAFKYSKPSTVSQKDRKAKATKSIVSKLSRGSSLLQRGQFSTRSDINARIDRLSKHDFLAD